METMSEWMQSLIGQCQADSDWNQPLSAYLRRNGFSASDSILPLFQELRRLPGFSARFEKILPPLLLSGDLKKALVLLDDFCVLFEEKVCHPFDFNHPHSPALLSIFATSEFLTRHLLKYPRLGATVLESPFLLQCKSLQTMLAELLERLNQYDFLDKTILKKELRLFKYEEFLRITIRDLAEIAPFVEILEELTAVATCCAQIALEGAHKIAQGIIPFKIPHDASEQPALFQQSAPFIVLGLGKLGGNELNYSSDIDPMLICTEDPNEYDHPLTADKTLIKTAQCWIEMLGETTEDGFVARIDMRLRPGGETAPLFQSLEGTEFYYETQGTTWERQALVKARPVAGNLTAGTMLLKNLSPFIYSKQIDKNMHSEIRKIKERIEKEHLKEHLNVKLGVGGIREIEFFVQIFQLLYGGSQPFLRLQNTLKTIDLLAQKNYIPFSDANALRHAYIYLRKLEHRLQMVQELQTHVIPGDVRQQQILARHMGYEEEDIERARRHFLQDLKDAMFRVRSIFSALFDQEYLEIEAAIRNNTHFVDISTEEHALFENSARQFAALIRQSESAHTDASRKDTNPLALRFQQLFERIQARVDYYQHLLEHPASLQRLSRIAETSEFLWNYLLNHLELLKQLDAREILHSRVDWEAQLAAKLDECEGEEDRLDALREFKHAITFLIGSAELEGIQFYEQARQRLTILAEVILQATYLIVREQMSERFGFPYTCKEPARLAIIGMGKLGGSELTYHSDLDLIFICSGEGTTSGPRQISNYEYYAKLIQRLISALSSFTRNGYAYRVDTRLRPSGNDGPLVSTLSYYETYHQTSLPWERQALLKGRVVAGDLEHDWVATVEETKTRAIFGNRIPKDLKQQIAHLRGRKEKEVLQETEHQKNIKEGYGGMLDIEYLTQYLQMSCGEKIPDLQNPRTLEVLRKLEKHQILDHPTSETLRKAYTFYHLMESYLRLLCDTDTNMLDFDHLQSRKLIAFLHHHGFSVTDVYKTYQKTSQTVRSLYSQIMKDGP